VYKTTATTRVGRIVPYRKLVLAVGSRAHVPPIPGRQLPGVFTFRNIDDVECLVARSFRSRRTIVIGGGLLGLEAARGMARRGADTWVIEHNAHLMPNQLDAEAAGLLASALGKLGLIVRTSQSVTAISGNERVEAIELAGGERVGCDTVIICTGIRANIELARDVGLAVGRGIKVSDRMLTSDPDIYAVGECAEHNETTCGLVGPGFEQAVVAADNIAGIDRVYGGSTPSTKLKLVGIDVFSMGDVEQLAQRHDVSTATFRDKEKEIYRTIVVRKGRLIGALGIGDWPEVSRLQEAIRSEVRILPWQRFQFRRNGALWPGRQATSVHDWPRQATVCNCTGVTRGQIGDAIALGAVTYEDVQRETGASTVCGSCRPQIADLLGDAPKIEAIRWWKWVASLSVAAAILLIVTLGLPPWPTARSVADIGLPDKLWLDGIWKQTTGYTLLAISVVAASLSGRKRWVPGALARRLGDYAAWRLVHVSIGVAALVALFVHTGFRLGDNLNFWLMAAFLATCLSGVAMGFATALEHRLAAGGAARGRPRAIALWLHILALWPLPLLLGLHILSVYFY
jgi:nitrite reductase (NADH) large subunit